MLAHIFSRYLQITDWTIISTQTIKNNNLLSIFNGYDKDIHCLVDIDSLSLLDERGQEITIYSIDRDAIACRKAIVNEDSRSCSVFVKLSKIQSLFNPSGAFLAVDSHNCNIENDHPIHIDTYPVAFLRDIGNVQADSIPSCFYSMITRIN